jgi:hypothetical protein
MTSPPIRIHGRHGLQAPWRIQASAADSATLLLHSKPRKPYSRHAVAEKTDLTGTTARPEMTAHEITGGFHQCERQHALHAARQDIYCTRVFQLSAGTRLSAAAIDVYSERQSQAARLTTFMLSMPPLQ